MLTEVSLEVDTQSLKTSFLCFLMSLESTCSPASFRAERSSHAFAFSTISASVDRREIWTENDKYWDAYWDIQRNLKAEIEGAGLNIPFPQRVVTFVNASDAKPGE